VDRQTALVDGRPIGFGPKLVDRLIEARFDATIGQAGLARRHWQVLTMLRNGPAILQQIDAEAAGAGTPGIDLGTLRLDAALCYGPGAANQILDGWRQATGREPELVAYWDVVAALTTVGDMTECMPPLLDHHRPDLDARILTTRRNAFLSAALTLLNA
jgi:hypothetical protein